MTNPLGDLSSINGDVEQEQQAAIEAQTLATVLEANAADEVRLTDKGNGRRFTELYQHLTRYLVDQDTWVVRTGVHWQLDDAENLRVYGLTGGVIRKIREEGAISALSGGDNADAIRARYENFANQTEGHAARLRVIATAREHPELVIEEEGLDADLDLVATPSGVVNLLTGEVREAVTDDLCTRVTIADYVPDAKSDLLDEYLETFVPDEEDQRVLFATLGTCLRGGNAGRLFPIILGGTTSGKSQLLSALDKLLGGYMCSINVSVFRGNLDDKPRPDLVRAMYHRIAYAVEASKIWELHADQVKRLTGGDAVPYRNLYSQSVERVPRFTPLIITNVMPRVKGADQAFKRRMLTLRFDQTLDPAKEDTSKKDKFINDPGCQRALFARIVQGASDELLRDGIKWHLMPTKYAQDVLESFGQLDHVDEFLEWLKERETLSVGDKAEVTASHCAKATDLHEWYGYWIAKHGNKQDKGELLNLKEFNSALRDRGWESKTSNGVRWLGVRLQLTVPTT